MLMFNIFSHICLQFFDMKVFYICPPNIILDLFCLFDIPYSWVITPPPNFTIFLLACDEKYY